MLIGIGDEDAIAGVISRYRETLAGYDAVRDLVETGQPLGIPYLAADLTGDRFLIVEQKLPDGRVVSVKPEEKRHASASYIIYLVIYSRAFGDDVRESARRLQEIELTDMVRFVGLVTGWWRQNEAHLTAHEFSKVSPFPNPFAPVSEGSQATEVGEPAPQLDPSPPAATPAGEIAKPETASHARTARGPWLWILGAALVLGFGAVVIRLTKTR